MKEENKNGKGQLQNGYKVFFYLAIVFNLKSLRYTEPLVTVPNVQLIVSGIEFFANFVRVSQGAVWKSLLGSDFLP